MVGGRGEAFARNFRYCMTVYSFIKFNGFLFSGILISVESMLRLNYGCHLLFCLQLGAKTHVTSLKN